MASQEGFEPPTTRLEGECSIQLSYWDIIKPPKATSFLKYAAFCGVNIRFGAGEGNTQNLDGAGEGNTQILIKCPFGAKP